MNLDSLVSHKPVDCKTVRIIACSSTCELSNRRSGTRLKTESETGERRKNTVFFSRLTRPTGVWGSRASRAYDSYATLSRFLYWFWKKPDCFAVYRPEAGLNGFPCAQPTCCPSRLFVFFAVTLGQEGQDSSTSSPLVFHFRAPYHGTDRTWNLPWREPNTGSLGSSHWTGSVDVIRFEFGIKPTERLRPLRTIWPGSSNGQRWGASSGITLGLF